MDYPEVMGIEETAKFLDISEATLRKEAREGNLPARKVGREWRFSKAALLRWLAGADHTEGGCLDNGERKDG